MTKLIEERVRKIKPVYKILFYIGMGILWSLANVGYSFGFLTWFALVPLLFFLRYETLKSAAIYSSLFGFVFYLTNFWWMGVPFVKFFGGNPFTAILGGIIGSLAVIILSAWHGLSYSVAVFLTKYVSEKKSQMFYAAFPIIMTAADYFFPKLWHDQIGYSQYIFLGFCQTADIFGVPIITLIILFCNVTVLMIVESYLLRKPMHIPIISFFCVIAVVIVTIVYGNLRLDQLNTIMEDTPKAKIAVVQGNISRANKHKANRSKKEDSRRPNIYNRLTMSVLDQSPDLVVWPESAMMTKLDANLEYFDNIMQFRGMPLLFGSSAIIYNHLDDKAKAVRYNSLFFVNENARIIDRYDKMRLIPFAETMPLPGLSYLMNWYGLVPFTEGQSHRIMTVGDIRFSPNICYEDLMPDLIRRGMNVKLNREKQKANLIVNATNDSWFGSTPAARMHLHISVFRAIENRRTLIRSTCTGYSMACLPTGQMINRTNLDEEAAFVSEVPLSDENTVYDNGGWMFVYILLIIALALPLGTFIMRGHRQLQLNKRLREKRHQEQLFQSWMD
ncbi:MAG: apolipoprotein N-acyltransferase [Spirochaetales bacterium]|nr:apolipoprotein N-acyltransferase [Spirochaetales bacterium]